MISEQQAQQVRAHLNQLKPTWGGKFFYYCVPFRKQVVLENLNRVFGNSLTPNEIIKLALCFYSHVFTSLQENLCMRFRSQKALKKRVVVIGDEHLWKLLGNKVKGAMIITGHFGNWEFAPIAGMLNFQDWRGHFLFLRKTLSNKYIERLVFHRYYRAGLGVIPKKNSLAQVCEALENNKIVIFVMDQHASIKAKDGIRVDFFGHQAGTFRSVAMIAAHTEVPVVPGRSYRRPDGKHVVEFFPPLPWITCASPNEEIYANTQHYNQVLERMILDHPEQWLWMHRRWKTT